MATNPGRFHWQQSIRAMSGLIQGTTTNYLQKTRPQDSKTILKELIEIVRECQTRYGGKTELATEQDQRILKLCATWENALSHGLRNNASVLKNVQDIVSGGTLEPQCFWDFAYTHLTKHEKERFSTLRHVWTDRGKVRALIRAAFNERAMERYILIWLNDINLKNNYENWAFIMDDEAVNLLPSIAAGLGSILFAISVDTPDLNVMSSKKPSRTEPVIAAQSPKQPITIKQKTKRQIISFDNDDVSSNSSSICGSAPKSLSSMCLKIDESKSTKDVETTIARNTNNYQEQNVRTNFPLTIPNDQHLIAPIPSNERNVYGEVETQSQNPMTFEAICTNDDLSRFLNEECIRTPQSDSGMLDTFEGGDSTNTSSSQQPSKRSSIVSSIDSANATTTIDTDDLKVRLQEALDRCATLENRVAELSLENHRLKTLNNNSSRQGFNYFSISVPRVLLQRNAAKKYYAYEVHIIPTHGGDEWTILRRYNDFYRLHKQFQKDNVAVKTLDFPPKKLGNMNAHFVEQRRQRLQVYLRHLLTILPDVSSCTTRTQLEQVFPFFK